MDSGLYGRYESGHNKPSLETLEKIISTFPKLNAGWLISGHGEMFLAVAPTDPKPLQVVADADADKWFKEQIRQKDEQIKFLTDLLRSGGDLSKLTPTGSFNMDGRQATEQPVMFARRA